MNRLLRIFVASLALSIAPLLSHAAGPLYPAVASANADIEAALKDAKQSHKRIIVDFGGDWCGDCKVLDINFRKPENEAILKAHFILVHVNVGEKGITENFAVGDRFGIPLKKGVPALAVLDSDGKLLYSQKNGEFESMRKMDPQSVNDFLKKWQGQGQ